MNQKLQLAIQAARIGDNKKAQYLLSQTLQENPEEVQAWYLLSLLVDSEAKQTAYLQRALALDPTHEKAKARLTELTAPTMATFPPVEDEAQDIAAQPEWEDVEEEKEETWWHEETAVAPTPPLAEPTLEPDKTDEDEAAETVESLSHILEQREENKAKESALAIQPAAKDTKETAGRKPKSKDEQLQVILYLLVALAVIVGIALIYTLFFM